MNRRIKASVKKISEEYVDDWWNNINKKKWENNIESIGKGYSKTRTVSSRRIQLDRARIEINSRYPEENLVNEEEWKSDFEESTSENVSYTWNVQLINSLID